MGSTPAMIENAMASGISASATTVPASNSRVMLGAHSLRRCTRFMITFDGPTRILALVGHNPTSGTRRRSRLRYPTDWRSEEPPGISPGPVLWSLYRGL